MASTEKLISERANIWEQMKALMDRAEAENRDLTGEEVQTYERLENDLDAKGTELARRERFDTRNAEFSRVDRSGVTDPADSDEEDLETGYTEAFARFMRSGMSALDHEDQKVLRAGFVQGPSNAAGVGTGAAGGYTVPPAFRAKIVEAMNFVANMRTLAEVISTETGAQLPWPTVDDTSNEGAILAENTQVTEQDVTFGTNNLDAYMYTSKLVRVSLQLLQDNAFDLEAFLARALGARIGRIQNRHFTVGTGTNQPDGIVTSASVGKQGAAGQVTTVTYDDLVDLIDSVDAAYLEAGNARFMMSQAARRALRKLKDGQNRPLWEPSLQAGTPDTLMGYGLSLNNYMPAPGASAKSILFGDIREAYVIRDVSDFAIMRLTERYADYLQVGFLGFQRSDGTMQNASAVKVYQHPAA